MSDYFFIQSQDPFTEVSATQHYQLARQLKDAGHNVSMLLVQNAVIPARRGAQSAAFDELLQSGVTLFADDFSLRQREIDSTDLKQPTSVSSISAVIDAMLAGHKVIWN